MFKSPPCLYHPAGNARSQTVLKETTTLHITNYEYKTQVQKRLFW